MSTGIAKYFSKAATEKWQTLGAKYARSVEWIGTKMMVVVLLPV